MVGATGGLGAHLAQGLAAQGARVSLIGRDGDRLAALADTLGAAAVSVTQVDLTRPEAPAVAIEAAVQAAGPIDVLVYAAGVVAFGGIADLDDDVLDDLVLVNLLAPVRLLRSALPHLGEGSAVVHLSAVLAEAPMAGLAAYGATKAALTSFDGAAARELRRRRVRLLDARPPHTETGLVTRALAGEAPRLPEGLAPTQVADRVVQALLDDETDLPSSAF